MGSNPIRCSNKTLYRVSDQLLRSLAHLSSLRSLWLTVPLAVSAMAALVLGYESPYLQRSVKFPRFLPLVSVDANVKPTLMQRVCVYAFVLLPWLIAYESVVRLGIPGSALTTYTSFDNRVPVIQWTEAVYASTYLVVLLTPGLLQRQCALRRFATQALVAMVVVFPAFVLLPLVAPPRPFIATAPLGHLMQLERSLDSAAGAFPSFHVIWACIAASVLGSARGWKRYLWIAWASLVAISCVTTGMHSVLDVVSGIVVYVFIAKLQFLWLDYPKPSKL